MKIKNDFTYRTFSKFCAIFIFILSPLFACCQQTQYLESWTKTKGSTDDFFNNIVSITNSDNDVYVAASKLNDYGYYDLILTKYHKSGTEYWSTTYNLSNAGNAIVGDITLDNNENIVLTGTAFNGTNNYDLFIIKYNNSGTLLWEKTYNGAASLYDAGKSVICDANNNVYVTGGSFEQITHADMLTIAYNTNGVQQWISHYDGNGLNDGALSIEIQNTNNLVITGPTQFATNQWAYTAVQYSITTGIELSSMTTIGSSMDEFTALTIDANENVYLTGSIRDANTGYFDYKTFKLSTNLQIIWEATYASTTGKDDKAKAIDVDVLGNVFVTGTSHNGVNNDFLTIKYNHSGVLQWTKKYDGLADDAANDLIINSNNEVFVTGYTSKLGKKDYYTLLYDNDGNELWATSHNGLYNKNDEAKKISLDKEENILVSGSSQELDQTTYLTVKYAKHDIIIPPSNEKIATSIYYTENRGQLKNMDHNPVPDIQYYSQQRSPLLYFQDDKISFVLASVDTFSTTQDTTHRVDLAFHKSGRRNTQVKPLDKRSDYYNYYLGHIPAGREQVALYDRLIYPDVFDHIDLLLSSNGNGTKYYFICKPSSHPDSISLNFTGQNGLASIGGNLHISTLLEDIVLDQATVFQIDHNGNAIALPWTPNYLVNGGEVNLSSGAYDHTLPLVFEISKPITPPMCEVDNTGILYSTYYGEAMLDEASDMCRGKTVDQLTSNNAIGDIYIVGITASINFPVLGTNINSTLQGSIDVFVMSLSGLARNWVTHFGGNEKFDGTAGYTFGQSIAYDQTNQFIYFCGFTNCNDLPITEEEDDPINDYIGSPVSGNYDKPLLAKLNIDGEFEYGTYFGGNNSVISRATTLDINRQGHLFMAGASSQSPDLEDNGGVFYQDSDNDGGGFIAEFDLAHRLIWSTRFSGGAAAGVSDIKFDEEGNLFVTGNVTAEGTQTMDFKNQSGINDYFKNNSQGKDDAFIAKFRITENDRALIWSTLFGGNDNDYTGRLGINAKNEVYLIGYTETENTSFPITEDAIDQVSECGEFFITQFSNTGILEYSSFYGGSQNDGNVFSICPGAQTDLGTQGRLKCAIDFDRRDNVYISGTTKSTNFVTDPLNNMYHQSTLSNDSPQGVTADAFVLMFDNTMDRKWATYFGGKREVEAANFHTGEGGHGLIVVNDRLFLSGRTDSFCSKIPLKDNNEANYYQDDLLGGSSAFPHDAFITVFDIEPILTTPTNEINQNHDLIIYPSPANAYINIQLPNKLQAPNHLVLVDILGRTIISQKIRAGERTIQLNTQNVLSGIYFISIQSKEVQISQKVIITH